MGKSAQPFDTCYHTNRMAKKKKLQQKIRRLLLILLFSFFLLLLSFSVFNIYFSGLIYPKTTVAGISISGRTPTEASEILSKNISLPTQIVLVWDEKKFNIDLNELGFIYDFDTSAGAAYSLTRSGNIFLDFYRRFASLFEKSELGLKFNLDEDKLKEALSVVNSSVSTPPVYPSIKLIKGKVWVEKGSAGTELDKDKVIAEIYTSLSKAKEEEISLTLATVDPSINENQANELAQRAEKIAAKSLNFTFEFQTFTFSGQNFLNFLNPEGGYGEKEIKEAVSKLAGSVNRPPSDPTFVFENGRVKEFAPAKDGVIVREDTLAEMIVGNLTTLEISDEGQITLDVPVDKTPSKIKTEDVNDLGIKELIGRGASRFAHSIPNRIYNIGLASSRFKGILVKPGEVFSFNDVLGDVSAFTGYKQAFVIKEGKTVLGDGGGVCQVSSTLFRAILDAGLPIVERRAHSYRVGYYEQDSPPGFDATVYAPSADLKFKNDTPGHLLIQPVFDTKAQTLVFEIYGTNDGRISTTTKPKISGVTPAPPDLYVDDPTLPTGVVKQIDFRASGAKVSFDYKVTRGSEDLYSKTFVSNYLPWQAVYLRGTGPVQ